MAIADRKPDAEFLNVDRAALIQAISKKSGVTHLNTATTASIWLDDTSKLRELEQRKDVRSGLRAIQKTVNDTFARGYSESCEDEATELAEQSTEKPTKRLAETTPISSERPLKIARVSEEDY
ncbi:uncharacterized protein BDV17DRAFT_292415 [Aspergillus undulatus]|uniref:uncharacterized protein n=1 Tax=Aspergillus undulatus TaxID=1810928 RepID=UPI003CCDE325